MGVHLMGANVADWISAISALVVMITAVVMAILAYKTYMAEASQREQEAVEGEIEAAKGEAEIVFDTSKQQTTLKVTQNGLEADLDYKDGRSTRRGNPQWTLSPQQCERILQDRNFSVDPGYKVRTGRFSIGSRKNWLYSKSRFAEPDYLRNTIVHLLQQAAAR